MKDRICVLEFPSNLGLKAGKRSLKANIKCI